MKRLKLYGHAGRVLSTELRGLGLSNEAAADRLKVPHGTLRGWLSGWSAPDDNGPVWHRMHEQFGADLATRYRQAVEESRVPNSERDDDAARVERLIDRGRLREARRLLDETGGSQNQRSASFLHLGRALFDQGDSETGTECYHQALAAARDGSTTAAEGIVLELGSRLTAVRAFTAGRELLSSELAAHHDSWRLWKRLGVLQWYEGDLMGSFASLTTAHAVGGPLPRVSHARGQVLAELGRWQEALVDLKLAIDEPLSHMSQGYVRSCRAYVWYELGKVADAEQEFEHIATITPDNAWHFYRWARCREMSGDRAAAAQLFRKGLELEGPPLVPRQIEDAKVRLRRIIEE